MQIRKPNSIKNKKNRELVLTVSVFLLGREELRTLFWNIMHADYNGSTNALNVGISTIEGKYGTTLQKLRKTSKHLSEYLYESGLTFRKSHVNFYIDKEEDELARIGNILNLIETHSQK